MVTLLRFPGIGRTSLAFRAELVRLAARLRLDPNGLAVVMSQESGFDPSAVNRKSGATGLIQFMPSTAKRLGTTVEELRRMSDVCQLAFVERYFAPFAGRLRTPGDYYMATFNPAHVGKPREFVLYESGQPGYDQNAGLDRDGDGVITIGDVTAAIDARWNAAQGATLEVDETVPLARAVADVAAASSSSPSSGPLSTSPASEDRVDTLPPDTEPVPDLSEFQDDWSLRQSVVELALRELGHQDAIKYWREVMPGLTEFQYRQFADTQQWCGGFALWCLHQRGLGVGIVWKMGAGFRPRLPTTKEPLPGDIAYMIKDARGRSVNHYAIVRRVTADMIATVDGNQAGDTVGVADRPRSSFDAFFSIQPLLDEVRL